MAVEDLGFTPSVGGIFGQIEQHEMKVRRAAFDRLAQPHR